MTTKRPHEVPISMPKKIDQELKDQVISMYIAGITAPQISEETGVKLTSVKKIAERNQLGQLRKVTESKAITKLTDLVAESKVRTIEVIDPLVEKLVIKAHKLLDGAEADDMTPKDVLNALEPLIRIRSRLKGEITQKHEINTNTALFMQIMEAAERMPKEAIEVKEWDLIE